MRLSIVAAIATLSATAFGQLQGQIPACAQSCFSTDNLGTCSLIQVDCICGSSAITEVACCVLSTCSQADIDTTITFATALCRGAGVELNTNPDCGATNSSASASSSASAAASSSASASASSSVSASSSAALTALSGTNTPSGSATRSSASSASSSASATAATGAGAFQTAGPVLGLGVAVIGVLAAL